MKISSMRVVCCLCLVVGCAKVDKDLSSDGPPLEDAKSGDCPAIASGQWVELGAPVVTAGSDTNPTWLSLVNDEKGYPIVSWSQKLNGQGTPSDILVSRYDNNTWNQLGQPISINPDNTYAYAPKLGYGDGRLILMFAEQGSPFGTGYYAAEWHDSLWTLISGAALNTNNGTSSQGDVFFSEAGDLYLAWRQTALGESSGRYRVNVKRFQKNDTQGELLTPEQGGVVSETSSAAYPQVAVTAQGRIVTAFAESGVRVTRRNLDNTQWESLGEKISAAGNNSYSPQIGLRASDDAIWIAMSEYDGDETNVYVMRWDGATWKEVGKFDDTPDTTSTVIDFEFDDEDRPVVGYRYGSLSKYQFTVTRAEGTTFQSLGDVPFLAGAAEHTHTYAAMAINRSCNAIDAAVIERDLDNNQYALRVFRYAD